MSKIVYPKSSPYANTPQTSWHIGRFVNRPIPPASDDTLYVVQSSQEFKPDKLSYDLYGTPVYWWVFMIRNINQIRDPIYDLVAGMTIVVPSKSYLESILT